jgi:hypothetical protein
VVFHLAPHLGGHKYLGDNRPTASRGSVTSRVSVSSRRLHTALMVGRRQQTQ